MILETQEENILGYEKIGKLIKKFSIPCIISLVVNALYNMVDQIFIGWGVGYLGNGATNVVFPLVITCLAFALMIGDGTSAYFGLKLGQKKKDDAAKGVANGIATALIVSTLFCIFSLIFLPQLLNLFGCTDNLREYALSYGRIICLGIPFMIVGTALNSVIRTDGSPKYSMMSMVIGAALNIVLDPIFIFKFKMGVEGAAIATIISQFVTFFFNFIYIWKFKSIKLTKDLFIPDLKVIKRLIVLGFSSFITQMSFVIVFSVENRYLAKFGADSKYGSEIPITVLGIVLKINQILNSIIIGIAAGGQTICGFNYGAERYDRVKKTLKYVLTLSISTAVVAFVLFQTIPDKIISIFGSGDANYMEFACLSFRIFLMLCICNAVQIPAGIFFQGIGKSVISAILSLSRQIILLVPAIIILSNMYGVMGVLYAGPVADGIAFILAVYMLRREMKNLDKKHSKVVSKDEKVKELPNGAKSKQVVITIAREYGSGGRYVGRLVAEKLGIKFYDNDVIRKAAEETGLSQEYIIKNEQQRETSISSEFYSGLDNSDELFLKESEIIKSLADKGPCVIIGRCSNFILQDREDLIRVFVYSSLEDKINRVTKFYGLDKVKAEKEIKRINKLRANHFKHYTEREWQDASNYDLCINSDALGVEKSADLICKLVDSKIN